MRKTMIAALAAVALGAGAVTTAVAAPHGGGGGGGHFGGGGGAHMGGFGGGGVHMGGLGRGHRGPAFAGRGGHDRDHRRHRSFAFGPGYGGLYDYDGNWPYCNTGRPDYYNYNSCSDSDWND